MTQIKFLFAAMFAAFLTLTATSCGDGNDEPALPAAKTIEGSYHGDLECTVMGSASVFGDRTFTVTATDASTVTIVLPAFGEAPMALPSINIAGVKVTGADGVTSLATTEVSGQTDAGKSYTCTLSGTVEGATLTLKFNLVYGAMPMPMICSATALRR